MKNLRASLIVGAVGLAMAICLLLILWLDREAESLVRTQVIEMLDRETALVRTNLESGTFTRAQAASVMASLNLRLTLIDSTGRVLYDTNVDSARLGSLENHLTRPEIADALVNGTGHGTRMSATTGVEQLYAARHNPLRATLDGEALPVAFVRLSLSLSAANERVAAVRGRIILAALMILVLIAGAVALFARRVLGPVIAMSHTARLIGEGDLSRRVVVNTRDELGDLGNTINAMVEKLESDIRELERLGRYRSEFLGDVSHELRTPIFAIQGSVETVLSDDKMPSDVRRSFLNTAMRNTERLNALVSDLIDTSRIESREMRLSLRYFDIVPLLNDIAADLHPAAQRKGLALTVETSDNEVSVFGDRERLRQVLVNLADNAIKNTENGGVTLRCAVEGETARIAIADTGVGIPAEHISRIFERFYRVDKDRSRASGGTGLGLAIVKHILEAHGSQIHVESTPDKGSTFWFNLKM